MFLKNYYLLINFFFLIRVTEKNKSNDIIYKYSLTLKVRIMQ
jgi:hypothetical protein